MAVLPNENLARRSAQSVCDGVRERFGVLGGKIIGADRAAGS
jgi:hypothetical protein